MNHLLNVVIFTPLLFAAIVALLPAREQGQIRVTALVGSLASLGTAIALYALFDPSGAEFQFEFSRPWIAPLGIGYHVGIDGLAVTLILLTALLGPIALLSTWSSVNKRVKELALSLLVLQSAMYGTFAALDLALFYLFWELMLVPMYLLIGIWGSERRVYAAVKFFLYTFAGSVLMLAAIIFLHVKSAAAGAGTFDYPTLLAALHDPAAPLGLSWAAQKWLFVAFALAFAIKVPMFPLHTWLPDAHVQAPAAGSIILAGVLLKMGAFGFLRFAMPFFPQAAAYFRPALLILAVVGIVYGSLMAFAQKDIKKLIAYSSVAHLGFVMLGIMALTVEASTGAMYQMINHGVSTGALFLLIGILYERTHTRWIADYGGIAKVVPMYAAVFMLILLSSIGLPGTNGFVGEFLILVGSFTAPLTAGLGEAASSITTPLWTAIASTGVVLGAIYMLRMYQRVMFGPVRHPENRKLVDLNLREWLAIAPLAALVVVMGVLPGPFLDRLEPSARRFVSLVAPAAPQPDAQAAAAPAEPRHRPDPHAVLRNRNRHNPFRLADPHSPGLAPSPRPLPRAFLEGKLIKPAHDAEKDQ